MSESRYPALTAAGIEEARALIGVPLRRRPQYRAATRETLLRYAKGLGSRNPLYSDLAHGLLKTPWGALLGHPSCIFGFDHTVVAPKLAGIHAIYGGVRLEDVSRIIEETVIGGRMIDELLIPEEKLNCPPASRKSE